MTDPTIEALAQRRAEHLPGDYIQDGLLHCGACHSRKETRVELFGRRHRFTGSGECLEGMLHTALGSVPCVLQGRFSPEGVDAVLRTEERSFPLTGIPAWDGRDLK